MMIRDHTSLPHAQDPSCMGSLYLSPGWGALAADHTHTHTHIHTRAHTSLLFILILRDALGIGPNRQMACFLLLLCLSIFCFPTSCDEGGNHAPHCILIRLDVLKEERE